MYYVDFKELEIVENVKANEAGEPIRVTITLELDKLLDVPFTLFMEGLNELVKKQISEASATLADCKKKNIPVRFLVETDLNEIDIEFARDNIVNAVCRNLVISKMEFKHGERRLGVPTELVDVDIMVATKMEIINFLLKVELFTIKLYTKDNKEYGKLIDR